MGKEGRKGVEEADLHTGFVPVMAEADDDEALFFGENSLVHGPAGVKMGKKVRHRSPPPPPNPSSLLRANRSPSSLFCLVNCGDDEAETILRGSDDWTRA